MRRREPVDRSWPGWRYGPDGEAAIFQCEADVPLGWTRKPGEQPEPFTPKPAPEVLDVGELVLQLEQAGVEINPTWGVAHMKKVIDDLSSTR